MATVRLRQERDPRPPAQAQPPPAPRPAAAIWAGLYDEAMTAGARTQAGLEITSLANPRVKHLAALRHRRARDRAGVTPVEGFEELGLALAAGARPVSLYVCPALAGPGAQQMIDRVSDLGAEVILVSRAVFGKIAYRESPDGWLAVLPAVGTSLASLQTGANPLVLICEGVEKPGNLGAILRTADAAGVTAVIAADPVTDWANPNVVRASKGTVFSVPVASASTAEVLARSFASPLYDAVMLCDPTVREDVVTEAVVTP